VRQGDRVWVETRRDAAVFKVKLTTAFAKIRFFCRFTGRQQAANRLTTRARPHQPHAGIQSVRGAHQHVMDE